MEDPNKNNEQPKDIDNKKVYLAHFLASLESIDELADKNLVSAIEENVPKHLRATALEAVMNMKKELKSQFMLRGEVLASEFLDDLTSAKTEDIHALEAEASKSIVDLGTEFFTAYNDKAVVLLQEFKI